MNFDIKRLLYTIIAACIFFVIIAFFIKILPYILIAGVGIYGFIKIKGYITQRKLKNKQKSEIESKNTDTYYSQDDYFNGEVIDVDYEESNDKK